MTREVEAKIALQPGELDTLQHRLLDAGAHRGALDAEENVLFDAHDGSLRRSGCGLRLRFIDGRPQALLTYKGPVERGARFKAREELETRVEDGETAHAILEALGYRVSARYQKQREHWRIGSIEITLDHLDFGDYLEVEGEETAIDAALALLGLSGRPHIPQGYAELARRAGRLKEP